MRIAANHWALRVALFGGVMLAAVAGHPLRAAERPAQDYPAGENQRDSSRYFVDFHARNAPFFEAFDSKDRTP